MMKAMYNIMAQFQRECRTKSELNSTGNHQLQISAANPSEQHPSSGHVVHEIAGKGKEVLQINVSTPSEENPSGKQGVGVIPEMPSGEAKQQKRKSHGARKKRTKKMIEDDDSWMLEGWVKIVRQRSFTGKFPGYEDKFFYAPGVARPFRSKVASLRYIEKLKNATTGGQIHK